LRNLDLCALLCGLLRGTTNRLEERVLNVMIDCLDAILAMTINKNELRARAAQEIDIGDLGTALETKSIVKKQFHRVREKEQVRQGEEDHGEGAGLIKDNGSQFVCCF
jgi:hypothetical protein